MDGDWIGAIAGQNGLDGNFSRHPLFCEDSNPSDPWSLSSASPCLPGQHPSGVACELIGARPEGCSVVSTVDTDPASRSAHLTVVFSAPGTTTFLFEAAPSLTLRVVDALGRVVCVFGPSATSTGRVSWRGMTPRGPAAPGVYFVALEGPGVRDTGRFVLIR
jgi:hypothetical protein